MSAPRRCDQGQQGDPDHADEDHVDQEKMALTMEMMMMMMTMMMMMVMMMMMKDGAAVGEQSTDNL